MKIRALLLLALRSVGRNMRRSILTATAMALGLAILIFFRAIGEGVHEQWIDSAVRLGTGHVALQAPRFLETGRLEYRLDSTRVSEIVRALGDPSVATDVLAWAPHLTVSGLASSAAAAVPVRIEGVDPAREGRFSNLPDELQDGGYLRPGDRLRAFIGDALARRLNLRVGERFVLTAQTASGQVEGQMMRVVGTFHTGIEEIDDGLIHIPLQTERQWLGVPGAVTTVAVLLHDSREAERTVRALRATLGATSGIRVVGWRQASPEMDSAVRIDDFGDYIFHVVLFVIIALAILNAIMMSVLGRRREFGVLQALGLTGAETGWVVLGEGLFLTAAAGIVGTVAGFAFTWGFFHNGLNLGSLMGNMTVSGGIMSPVVIPMFRLQQVGLAVASIVIVGLLASLYPAWRASKLDVAEAMKFEQ